MKRKPMKWPLLWLIQFSGLMVFDGILVVLSLNTQSPASLYAFAMWAIMPMIGAGSAFWVTKRGLSHYAAWLAPPICQTAVHWVLTGYPPSSAGMPLVTAAISMVAAATAEVMRERKERRAK